VDPGSREQQTGHNDFNADQSGRHITYFVVNNQPGNVAIVNVFAPHSSKVNGALNIYLRENKRDLAT
jgi:hypothetical protein